MLKLERLGLSFGSTVALTDISLEVARGEVVCLLGPSGSGKSSLLRLIAGIEEPSAGRIFIDGIEVAGTNVFVEPENRRVGMVFQDFALFPHLTVAANVMFGVHGADVDVTALLARLGIGRLASHYPHMLSGGERQRVALARAMAPRPRVLLMDEPFSSLDSRLRDSVRAHTLSLVREAATTTVIVTHDPDEALRIADRIALLDRGRLVQVGTPEELYWAPRTLFAAEFFSDVAALPGTCTDGRLVTRLGSFPAAQLVLGASGIACIRPQHFAIAAQPTGVAGRVIAAQFCGDAHRLSIEIDGIAAPVALQVPRQGRAHPMRPGDTVHLRIDAERVPVVATQ